MMWRGCCGRLLLSRKLSFPGAWRRHLTNFLFPDFEGVFLPWAASVLPGSSWFDYCMGLQLHCIQKVPL